MGGGFFPASVPGLLAAYDMVTPGSGTTLTDLSGNGNALTFGTGGSFQPTWTAAGVACNSQFLESTSATWWASVKTALVWASFTPNASSFQSLMGGSSDNGSFFFLRHGDGLPGAWGSEFSPTTVASVKVTGNFGLGLTIGASPNRVYLNGVEAPGYYGQSAAALTPGGTTFRLAGRAGASPSYVGTLYYALFYSTVLSAGQVAAAHASYVAAKLAARGVTFGVAPPAGNAIVFDGDSLTAGFNATGANDYPQQLIGALSGSYPGWVNLGINGQTAAQIATAGPTRVDSTVASYGGRLKAYVLWAGTNDLNASVDPATTYASLTTRVATFKAAAPGVPVVLLTCLPRGASGTFETNRQTLNASTTGGAVANGYTVADVGADATIGAAGSQNNTVNYSTDKTHLTNAGYGVVAGIVKTALNAAGVT